MNWGVPVQPPNGQPPAAPGNSNPADRCRPIAASSIDGISIGYTVRTSADLPAATNEMGKWTMYRHKRSSVITDRLCILYTTIPQRRLSPDNFREKVSSIS